MTTGWRSSHRWNWVNLSFMDQVEAFDLAFHRRLVCEMRQSKDPFGSKKYKKFAAYNEIMGSVAERALAKWAGAPWEARIDTYHKVADIGQRVEVRWSNKAEMILRDNDEEIKERYFFLLTGTIPKIRVCGFLQGVDVFDKMDKANRKLYYTDNDRPPCWHIPEEMTKLLFEYPYESIME